MKRSKIILTGLLAMAIFATGCGRKDADEGTPNGPHGFVVNVSATANPSTVYVPDTLPARSSTITAAVRKSDGTPIGNATVLFILNGYGYLEGYKQTDTRVTNSSGVATIAYMVPPGFSEQGVIPVSITTVVPSDQRLDGYVVSSRIEDTVMLEIIPSTLTNVVNLHGHTKRAGDADGKGIQGAIVTAKDTNDKTVAVTTTRASGSWDMAVPRGFSGTVEATKSDYTFLPEAYSLSNVQTEMYGLDFYASGVPEGNFLLNPATLTVQGDGEGSNKTPPDPSYYEIFVTEGSGSAVAYTVTSGASWCPVSGGASGTTPGHFHIQPAANTTGASRTCTVTVTGVDGGSATLTVTQPAAGMSVSPSAISADVDGGAEEVSVSMEVMSYRVTTAAAWITVPSGTQTSGTFSIAIGANGTGTTRTGTVTVTGTSGGSATITVTQAGT